MFTIQKEFHFSASHILENLPTEHPCSRLHGHNYVVIIELQSKELDNQGFVLDYNDLDPIKKYIDTKLDHRHLNDCMQSSPTAENIALFLYRQFKPTFPKISRVGVKETQKTIAWFWE